MANSCNRCGRPIIWLSEEPRDVNQGGYQNPRWIRTEPKAIPIDPTPTKEGNIGIYKFPGDVPGGSDAETAFRNLERKATYYVRRMYHVALDVYRAADRAAGTITLFTSHYDTCRKGRRY